MVNFGLIGGIWRFKGKGELDELRKWGKQHGVYTHDIYFNYAIFVNREIVKADKNSVIVRLTPNPNLDEKFKIVFDRWGYATMRDEELEEVIRGILKGYKGVVGVNFVMEVRGKEILLIAEPLTERLNYRGKSIRAVVIHNKPKLTAIKIGSELVSELFPNQRHPKGRVDISYYIEDERLILKIKPNENGFYLLNENGIIFSKHLINLLNPKLGTIYSKNVYIKDGEVVAEFEKDLFDFERGLENYVREWAISRGLDFTDMEILEISGLLRHFFSGLVLSKLTPKDKLIRIDRKVLYLPEEVINEFFSKIPENFIEGDMVRVDIFEGTYREQRALFIIPYRNGEFYLTKGMPLLLPKDFGKAETTKYEVSPLGLIILL